MNKHLRLLLTAAFALVGMATWAWDADACYSIKASTADVYLTTNEMVSTSSAKKTYTFGAEAEAFKIIAVDGGYQIKSAVTEKYLGVNQWDAVNAPYSWSIDAVEGVENTYKINLKDQTNKGLGWDNAVAGQGVYTDKSGNTWVIEVIEYEEPAPEPDAVIDALSNSKVYAIKNARDGGYLLAKNGELWTTAKANVEANANDINQLWMVYYTEAGFYVLYSIGADAVANDTQGVNGKSNHWPLVSLDQVSYVTVNTDGTTFAFRDKDYTGDQAWLHYNSSYNTGVTNWTEASEPSRWILEEAFEAPAELTDLASIRAYVVAAALEAGNIAAAEADMARLEALQADLTQFIAGKEEYILADVRQAIETILGDAWATAINGAYEDAAENGAAYVSPDFWTTLETQIAWVKEQIDGVQNGTIALYTETGVVGDGTLNKAMPFFNTQVEVEAYANNMIVLKGWDGVEGSDLRIVYTPMNTLEEGDDVEVRNVITYIEQTVNGEVVSMTDAEDNEEGAVERVTLFPQSTYAAVEVVLESEMTTAYIGKDDEDGMGYVSLAGLFAKAAVGEPGEDGYQAPEAVSAVYMLQWPGTVIDVPAELVYEANGVTGTGIAGDNTLFANKAVHVEAYDNDSFIIRSWDGTLGSDLKVYTTTMATAEEGEDVEVRTVIIGLEQILNGEVVSEGYEDEDDTYVVLYPENEEYPMFSVKITDEMTGIMLDGEMGQLLLHGYAQPGSALGGEDDNMGVADPIETLYSVVWPGEPIIASDQIGNYELSTILMNATVKSFNGVNITFNDWDNVAFVSGKVVAENGGEVALDGGYVDDDTFNTIWVAPATEISQNGNYTLEVNVQLYKADAAPAPGMRRAGGVATLSIPFTVDTETGVASINAAAKAAIFNLNGQAVKSTQQGLYIINGKKAVVK